ncbi:hypothetical protein SAMN05660206_10622 [Sphingobacterium wenxiniae]|uniref:Uncharacterized protein n=2 Tax=Sphingobacterium wenxiniae TaxID=683125 RepID=A0A1I6T9K3_9SPHI|nr:hypothetical protein SAMN05660206_10622 [Sphingobacterium wenxiniae]
MQWQNEMAKYLRLLTDKYDAFDNDWDLTLLEEGYREFFHQQRSWMLGLSNEALQKYVETELEEEQIRPLALLFLRDAVLLEEGEEQQNLLKKSKFLLEYVSIKLGSFSFEDYGNLSLIDSKLKK